VRGEPVGQFGFFDTIDDRDVAAALFDRAGQWLKARGMVRMLGPTNPSMNDELGVLIDAFDLPPSIKMVWNPPYYPALFEGADFTKAKDLWAWTMFISDISERFIRVGKAAVKRSKVTLRHPDMKRFSREIELFREVYNQAWSANWGFVPWTEDEFRNVARSLKQVIDPELVLIAEMEGQPIGFSLALPDLNVALRHINGRLFPFGLPIMLWHSRKIKQLRILILGVIEEYRHRGIDVAFYYETLRIALKKGYENAEMSWILEDNTQMNGALDGIGARRYKTYRLYQREL